ncbi:MAG: HD domain-containing protein [Clostridiales Family XIII bacterium]|nr:HD domain-containing protein [Clostridiales Family XIII bacterium]
MIEKVKESVYKLLMNETSGHGSDHIDRVYRLAMTFAEKEQADTLVVCDENAPNETINKDIVALAALLHDVDDYKLVGKEGSEALTNARKIMTNVGIDNDLQGTVLQIIQTMGYNKYLKGIRPSSLEGKIVSDADMCDAIGANGIIRSVVYAVSPKANGTIFDKRIFPNANITSLEYNSDVTTHSTDNAINHFFEKLLKLKDLMMTESGRLEAVSRHEIMVEFLTHFFTEEDAPEWLEYLTCYLENPHSV